MKIRTLFKKIPVQEIKGSKEVEITGLCGHSKLVAPGNLFFAKRGKTSDGTRFIPEAIAAGAAAVLTDVYNPFFSQVVQIIHPDVAGIEAEVASTFYQHKDASLFLVGITGTNGKTTTSYLVKHLLDGLQEPSGLVGTIERITGKSVLPSTLTTSDVTTNYKLLHEMAAHGCKAAVMEVSSHALDQERVRLIEFDAAIFTNLTQDHLDYHQTMEQYAQAKAKLFSSLLSSEAARKKQFVKTAILNIDDPWHPLLVQGCRAQRMTYGLSPSADVRAEGILLKEEGMQWTVCYRSQKVPFTSPLAGRYNVYNCLAAICVGLSRGFDLEQILPLLSRPVAAPGRLQRVDNAAGLHIFVDYAHTEDALRNVLETLQELKRGRLITVFGCGGDRDAGKRPKMAFVAEALSDQVIVTSDNPRSEDPLEIIAQIRRGFKDPQKHAVIPDRKEAICAAIADCTKEDILLIAGKGHENYQIFAHQTISFDDRIVAQEAVNKRFS